MDLFVASGILAAAGVGVLLGRCLMRRGAAAGRCRTAEALAVAAQGLTDSRDVDAASAITTALAAVGSALGASRLEFHAHLHGVDGALPRLAMRHAWAAPGMAEAPRQEQPWHPQRARWLAELAAGRLVVATRDALPQDERPLLGAAEAIAVVPVSAQGRLLGCLLCLDAAARVRPAAELAVLRVLAELIPAAEARAAAVTQLAAARAEAGSGDRAKREFLANISHELRTPLNGVLGMAGLLLDTELDAHQREFAQVVRTSAENLLALLNDLIDLAKAGEGQKAERIRFDPLRLAEDVVAMLAERAHAKGVEIAVHPQDGLPRRTVGDATRLRQVLVNLVGNAIKFTARGHVVVHVAYEEGESGCLGYTVEDTGMGIDPTVRPHLFSAFTQGDGSTTRRFGGTGLGLAICRRLTEVMRGELACDSTPGKGSRFSVRVPSPECSSGASARTSLVASESLGACALVVEPCAPVRAAIAAACRRVGLVPEEVAGCREALQRLSAGGAEVPRVVLVAGNIPGAADLPREAERLGSAAAHILMAQVSRRPPLAEAQRLGFAACLVKPPRSARLADALNRALAKPGDDSSHAETGVHRRKPLKVLVVEDDAVNQMLAKAVLERDGIRVDVAADGHEALEALARARYDAVLMDLLMPVMDGFSCATEIRRLERERGQAAIAIIAVSALDEPETHARCREAGIDGCIRKPFEPKHLRRVLRNLAPERGRAAGA